MIPKEIKYNRHYDDVRGEFLCCVYISELPNYLYLEHNFMVPKIFDPLRFDCICQN